MTPQEAAALVVLGAGAVAALGYLVKVVRKVVHIADRIEALVEPTHDVVRHELTHNSGSSMKDAVSGLERKSALHGRGIERVGEAVAVVDHKVEAVRAEISEHGQQSRNAMAIYRKALSDQGIHLPVAPGEDGYGDTEEPPTMTRYTRTDWKARPATGGPGKLDPHRVEGVALHWPAMSGRLDTVGEVMAALRSWQAYHMDDLRWSDIGYQEAVDQAGNTYRLRGLKTQSGANGSEDVNERFGAILLIVGPGEQPSKAMIEAVRRRIARHRQIFPRSARIVGHVDVRPEPTACPGPAVLDLIRAGTFNPDRKENNR